MSCHERHELVVICRLKLIIANLIFQIKFSIEHLTQQIVYSGGARESLSIRVERWKEAEKPNADVLRRRMEAEGYNVFEWSDPPGTIYGPHSHGEDQSHWIVSGALRLGVGRERYTLRAGDRDFLSAHTEHSAVVPGRERVVYLVGVRHR